MTPTLATVDWIQAKADAAEERFRLRTRYGWGLVLFALFPGQYARREREEWRALRELYLSAVAEMSAESRRAALTRGVGRPALRIVKGGVA
jgi:hypothetical protein